MLTLYRVFVGHGVSFNVLSFVLRLIIPKNKFFVRLLMLDGKRYENFISVFYYIYSVTCVIYSETVNLCEELI